MPGLTFLDLAENQLTSITLPEGLSHLTVLNLGANPMTGLTLPAGLSSLSFLNLGDLLARLTLPLEMKGPDRIGPALRARIPHGNDHLLSGARAANHPHHHG